MGFDQARFDVDGFDGAIISVINRAYLYGSGDVDFNRGHRLRRISDINCYGEGDFDARVSKIWNGNASLIGIGALDAKFTRIVSRAGGMYGRGDIYALALVGVETTIQYNNILSPGETLVLDCQKFTAKKDGVNAISSISGDFPILYPGNNVVVYSDDDETRAANLKIRYRNRYV